MIGYGNKGLMKGRYALVNESLNFPHLVDAKLIAYWKQHKDYVIHLIGNEEPIYQACEKYKYIIDIDGNCGAMRLQTLLGQNIVVLKTSSHERQWFSSVLQPWIHYLPVTLHPVVIHEEELMKSYYEKRKFRQKSDLKDMMEWTMAHSNHSIQIMRAANLFHRDYLSPTAVRCYIRCLVHEVAKLLDFNVSAEIDKLSFPTKGWASNIDYN